MSDNDFLTVWLILIGLINIAAIVTFILGKESDE